MYVCYDIFSSLMVYKIFYYDLVCGNFGECIDTA